MKIKSLSEIPSVNAYLTRIGARPRSLRIAVVEERRGAYNADTATIHFSAEGKIKAPLFYEPTEREQLQIEAEWIKADWPQYSLVPAGVKLPDLIKDLPRELIFEFKDLHDNVVMIQSRQEIKGEKRYIPWTYWDDGEWRPMEPEGQLPIWGIEQLKDHSIVFIHEGAKAAAAVRRMVEAATPEQRKKLLNHPWGEELSSAAHVGWIGGALSPARTDWSMLKKAGITKAYIVSDNDAPGVAAVQKISKELRVPTFHVQFTNEWPESFDLADEFPDKMFEEIEGHRYYIGPSFRSCLHPATWATDLIPNPKGKPSVVLRQNFKDIWTYIEEADLFVCKEMPEIVRAEAIMNKMLSPFSDTPSTANLIVKAYTGRNTKMCYRPDNPGKIVTDGNTSAINLHTPSHVKPVQGSPEPFLKFMEYMFPNDSERHEAMRWCATLIAHPSVRMEYGLLLVSERQGVGKSTLGAAILSPLVGIQNVGYPTETQIVQSEFNGWMANKRLVIVHEIYSGHSWKAYNRLKSVITDKEVEVNEKYQRPYTIENWVHVFACSNSMRALKMEEDDRRWFYPEVTEEKWSRDKFAQFHNWLKSGGLGIIKTWAMNFGDYVAKGQPAPMTERKKELILQSRTEAQQEAAELAAAMERDNRQIVLTMKETVEWVRQSVQGRMYDSDLELRKAMKESGALWTDERILIKGRLQHAALNSAALEKLRQDGLRLKVVKGSVQVVADSNEDPELTKEKRKALQEKLKLMVLEPGAVMPNGM